MTNEWNKTFVKSVVGILQHPAPVIAVGYQKAMRDFLASEGPHYFVEQEVNDCAFIAALAVANMFLIGAGDPKTALANFLLHAGDALIDPDVNPLMDLLDKRPAK